MKFNEVPVDNYFRFTLVEKSTIYQRLSAQKIRDIKNHGIIVYRRNEAVQHLGSDLVVATNTPLDTSPTFKDVPTNHWFRFKTSSTAHIKMSKYKIRAFSLQYGFQCRTRNDERVEIFGESMLDVPLEYRH